MMNLLMTDVIYVYRRHDKSSFVIQLNLVFLELDDKFYNEFTNSLFSFVLVWHAAIFGSKPTKQIKCNPRFVLP